MAKCCVVSCCAKIKSFDSKEQNKRKKTTKCLNEIKRQMEGAGVEDFESENTEKSESSCCFGRLLNTNRLNFLLAVEYQYGFRDTTTKKL